MNRRDFITLVGGAAAAWPLAARAQQGDRVRRIGVLMPGDENDPVQKARLSAFTQALADLGWADGRRVEFVEQNDAAARRPGLISAFIFCFTLKSHGPSQQVR